MGKKVLVIDDSASIRKALQITLESQGISVVTAENGEEALEKLSSDLHLIFCDVNMPKMDGLTFVQTVKSNPKYKDFKYIPIVMLTTESSQEKKQQGQISGAKAWMVKPFLPERVLMVVDKLT